MIAITELCTQPDKVCRKELLAEMTRKYLIKLHCPDPDCWAHTAQNCTFDRTRFEEMLRADENIKVVGEICHHTWSLSEAMKTKLRKVLGLLRNVDGSES